MWKRQKRVYLDFAAAMPVARSARHAFLRALRIYGNPSAIHTEGRAARGLLEDARLTIARLTEVKKDDVIFTSGATEANALVLHGHVAALIQSGRLPKDIHILYAPTSHASIVKTAQALSQKGCIVEPLPILPEGQIDIPALRTQLRSETVLVSMDAVCGQTGIIWNTRAVQHVLEERKKSDGSRPFLHIDASQAPLANPITRTYWGADMLVLDAQKIGGIRGIGALIVHRTIPFLPITYGGSHERGIRPGTEPVALAVAFAAALEEIVREHKTFAASAKENRDILKHALTLIPHTIENSGKETVPYIFNLSLLGRDTDYLTALLDEAGFAVSTRSACESDGSGSQAVLELTGDTERAVSTLRISFGPSTKSKDLTNFVRALTKATAFLDVESI